MLKRWRNLFTSVPPLQMVPFKIDFSAQSSQALLHGTYSLLQKS